MSLVSWFPFNNNVVNKGTNRSQIGTYNGTYSFTTGGKLDKYCLHLGSGSPTIPNPFIGLDAWSFAFWYKANTPGQWTDIFTMSGGYNRIEFHQTNGAGITWYSNNTTYGAPITSGTALSVGLTNGKWYHICVVYDNGTSYFYLNGTSTITPQTGKTKLTSDGTDLIYFGSRINTSYCAVDIQDVRCYDHALSLKEVKDLSKGLCLHYKLNFEDLYEPVSSIRATGTQHIDLPGFPYGGHMIMEAKASIYENTGTDQDILANNSTLNLIMANFTGAGKRLQGKYVGWLEPVATDVLTIGTPYVIKSDFKEGQQTMYYNGIAVTWQSGYGTSTGLGSGTTTMRIFKALSGSYPMHGDLYYLKYWKDDELIYDLIPCVRITDAKPGLYDLVHNIFYTNSGSGEFVVTTTISTETPRFKDCSGYDHHGSLSNNITTTSDTPIGNHSAYLNNVWCVGSCPDYMPQLSVFMWEKQPSPTTQRFLFGTFNSWTNNGIGWWVDSGTTNLSNLVRVVEASTYSGATAFTNVCDGNWHHIGVTWDGLNYRTYKDGTLLGTTSITNGQIYNPVWYFGGALYNDEKMQGYLADVRVYATALSSSEISDLYNAKTMIDNFGNIHSNTFKEISESNITKTGIVKGVEFTEAIQFEGATWVPICVHYVPDGVFTSGNNTYNYQQENRWTNFGLIGTANRPESGYYEFLVMHQQTIDGPWRWWRFKQNVSPLTATWSQVNPSAVGTNVTRVSTNTGSNGYAGMYWYNSSNCPMCFANGSEGNWFGCGIRAWWGTGYIPSYNGEQCRGWQLVYMRVSKNQAKIYNSTMMNGTSIEEN